MRGSTGHLKKAFLHAWIPACAGMTGPGRGDESSRTTKHPGAAGFGFFGGVTEVNIILTKAEIHKAFKENIFVCVGPVYAGMKFIQDNSPQL